MMEGRTLLASNRIITENMLPGTPQAQWDISGIGDPSIQGYATDISVNVGETVNFKITDTNLAPYRIDIYRIGYYGGDGARLAGSVPSSQTIAVNQPAPLTDSSTGLVDAGNWSVTASWNVPLNAVSGVYFAKVTRNDTGGASHIVFIVRDDSSHSDILYQTSDTTWQAYNNWGGNSLYFGTGPGKNGAAYKVSYNRPFATRGSSPGVGDPNWFFYSEYPMIRWMEQNGYDVSYFAGVDSDRYGAEIQEHKVFASVGHDEYWSGDQRANVEDALANGVNLAFFSGNEMFWKIRYETSIDGKGTPYRTMVSYKETHANAQIDPLSLSSGVWTGTWMDPRFSPPADGGRPQNALTGTLFTVNRGPNETGTPFTVPASNAPMRFWRNTSVAQLQPGQTATIGDYYLGYEWDEDVDNGFRPAGLINLSSTTQNVPEKFIDYGSTVAPGTATHSLTLYRAPSGAMVFGAGTVQWSWGLDSVYYTPSVISTSDVRIQQATLNLFADMNVQPGSIMPGLIWSSASTDLTAPFSTISSPAGSSVFTTGVPVTISGTAADNGGGVVAGVEVSTDGGQTWHPAIGRNNWSYTWTPTVTGPAKILSRATDDSVNMEIASSNVNVIVALAATTPTGLVAAFNFDEGSGGLANDQSGSNNSGTLRNVTWVAGRSGGAASFNGIDSWVTIPHSASLDLTTGMTLEAWVNPASVSNSDPVIFKEGNGVSPYNLYSADNPIIPPSANIRTSAGTALIKGANPLTTNSWSHLAATYDGSTFKLYVNGALVGTSNSLSGSLQSSTGSLRIGGDAVYNNEFFQGLIDDVRVYNRALTISEIQADMSTPLGGTLDASSPTLSITSPANNASISGTVTVTANASDNVAIAGIQFLLDGVPLGKEIHSSPYSLAWDPAKVENGRHTLTARARDFAGNYTTSSAVSVLVNNPIDITPPTVRLMNPSNGSIIGGTTVFWALSSDLRGTPSVQFQVDGINVGLPVTSAPYRFLWDFTTVAGGPHTLTAIATDADGNSASSSISVTVDSTPPTVSSRTPSPGSTNISTASTVAVVFNEAIQPGSISMTVTGPNGTVAGSVTFNSSTNTATFAHPSPLAPQTVYTATVSGAVDFAGNVMAPLSWTFTTTNAIVDASLWGGSGTPAETSANDTDPIEVGVKFTSEISGFITGLSFYKGVANTGTHIGNLWSATGTLLATATFAGETASGWQKVNFASAVAIAANTTYIASYFAPIGGYAVTTNAFSSVGRDNAPLHIPSSPASGGNGVYRYGVGGGFPNSSFLGSNYWVDVAFSTVTTDATAPTVTARTPGVGATGVATSASATAVFSEAVQASTIVFTLKDAAGATVAATLTYNAATTTATLTPAAALAASTTYTASLSGAADTAGNVMAALSWSFTTQAASDVTAPTVTARTPGVGATGVATSTSVAATFSEAVQASTIVFTLKDPAGATVAATLTYNAATATATLTPTAALAASTTYTASLSGAADTAGNVMAALSWTFTTAPAPATTTTIWQASATPAVASVNDPDPVELGVKFRSDAAGTIAGVRFYKGAANTGTHVGHLWSATGTLLATATFAGETASGWQEIRFASAVAIAANTTYVVSYYAPSGGYAASGAYFASAGTDSGPLHALASGVDGGNGVYRYGVGGGFPTSSFNATNYWVDVVFSTATTDVTAPTVTSRTPAAGATGVATSASATAVFSEAVQASTIVFTLKDPAGATVASTLTYNASTTTATLTPTAALAASTTYTASLSGAADTAGNVMAALSWSFTTASQQVPPSQWTQTTAADFSGGTLDGTTVTNTDGGEVQMASNLVDDFSRTSLGSGWIVNTWKGSASNQMSGGVVSVLGEAIFSAQSFAAAPVEGRVAFGRVPNQHFGLATDLSNAATDTWAIFSTGATSNTLFARVNVAGTSRQANLGALPSGFHTYRIDPTSTGFNFLIDGVVRTSLAANLAAGLGLKIAASDYNNASQTPLQIDWVRRAQGTFTSSVFDAGSVVTWGQASWTAITPTGTTIAIETMTSLDGVSWSPWSAVTNGGTVSNPSGRYARYRAKLSTNDPTVTPTLTGFTLTWF